MKTRILFWSTILLMVQCSLDRSDQPLDMEHLLPADEVAATDVVSQEPVGVVFDRIDDDLFVLVTEGGVKNYQFFMLQTEGLPGAFRRTTLSKARIAYRKGALLLEDLESSERWLFFVAHADKNAFMTTGEIWEYQGYGLSWITNKALWLELYRNRKSNHWSNLKIASGVKCKCRLESEKDEDCDAGGVGAESCKIKRTVLSMVEECEVACSANTYACCTFDLL